MAAIESITLTFPNPLNVSVQVGDTVYYTNDENGDVIVEIGIITAVTMYSITANILSTTPRPDNNSFILFSKTNKTNISGLRGYYAEAQFRNDSIKRIELYSIGSEIFESSK
jgi:hypothetical protein